MRNWIEYRLKELGKSKAELARVMGVPYPRVHEVIHSKREVKVTEFPTFAEFLELSIPQAMGYYVGANVSDDGPGHTKQVPLISWVSAGELDEQVPVEDFTDFPTVAAVDLPRGRWIALRVDGASMNKISPPDSIIFVDLDDKALVPNRPYVIADETGQATYKRFEPDASPPFQPASYKDIKAPKLAGAIKVIGRVKRSMIDT